MRERRGSYNRRVVGCIHYFLLEQGQTQGSSLAMHQQTLTIGPYGNTYEEDEVEADEVSPEVAIGG
jgi:hypothetical protein